MSAKRPRFQSRNHRGTTGGQPLLHRNSDFTGPRAIYESDEDATYFKGGIYPMIMDSPFGSLDPTYQERVSRMLPEMAQQVVVMVTQSQWSEAVANEMEHVAGERYYLDYHDPGEESGTNYEYTDLVRKTGGDY